MARRTTIFIDMHQTQFQWRASTQFGSWNILSPNTHPDEGDTFILTGNTLHMNWEYSPAVQNLEGEKSVFVHRGDGLWILKEGAVKYRYPPLYGDYDVVNYFRGYLQFNGDPSTENLDHGIAYQFCYVYAPQTVTLPIAYPVWDDTMGAWLVGFSIYLWDNVDETQAYSYPFPDPFPEPVPAKNYNPLDY